MASCGFQPLYAPIKGSDRIAAPIKIATISDRNGQILRNYLVDIMIPEGAGQCPKYVLEVNLTEAISDIGVNKDETTRRKNATMTADLKLKDTKTNCVVYTHTAKAINSFSIISQNYFSDLTTEEYAKREALRLLAEKISLLIFTFLDSKNEG